MIITILLLLLFLLLFIILHLNFLMKLHFILFLGYFHFPYILLLHFHLHYNIHPHLQFILTNIHPHPHLHHLLVFHHPLLTLSFMRNLHLVRKAIYEMILFLKLAYFDFISGQEEIWIFNQRNDLFYLMGNQKYLNLLLELLFKNVLSTHQEGNDITIAFHSKQRLFQYLFP